MEAASFIEKHNDTVDGGAFKRIFRSNTATAMELSTVSCYSKVVGSINDQENVVADIVSISNGKLEKSLMGDPNGVSSFENFSIRDYVSAVRAKDITKNWPFGQRYLQKCLENGRQPFLPPFESPISGKETSQENLNGKETLVNGCDTQQTNAGSECLNKDKIEDPNNSENGLIAHKGVGKRRQKNRRKKKKLVPRKARQHQSLLGTGKECVVLEGIEDQLKEEPNEEKEFSRITMQNDDKHQETETELIIPCEHQSKDCVPDRDTLSFIESPNAQCEITQAMCELMYKGKDNKSELDDIQINETGEKKRNNIVACEIKSQDDNKKDQSLEKSKADPGKNEEFGNPGSLPEAMIPKVCPVCRSFSSTSNIALNAHIDHCLSGESNPKKSGTKFSKPKVKVRKKRSILDIIAAAPVCTLEDLDYSTSKEQSTADTHPLPLDQLNLRDTTKQRQHRCKDPNVHVSRKGKKLRILSNLKEDCQPDSREDPQKKKRSSFDGKYEEVSPKKIKRVASNSSPCDKRDAISSKRLKNKVQATSATKRSLSKDTVKGKSTSTLVEALHENGPLRSGNGSLQPCSSGQESTKAGTYQERLANFKEDGGDQASSENNDGGPTGVLETVSRNQLDAELQRSPAKFTSPPASEADDIHMTVSGKTNNARSEVEISKNNCSPLEVSDGFTCKRKKHVSKCRTKHSPTCNTNPASFEVCQEEEHICDEDKVGQDCVMVSSDDSLRNALEPQMPKSSSVSKTREHDPGLSSDRIESSVKCQLSGSELKEQSSSINLLEKSSTLVRPTTLFSEAGGLQSKESTTNRMGNSNAQEQQARPFRCDISSDKMENFAADIIQDMKNVKEASTDVIAKKAMALDLDAQSKTVYDVELINNHDDITIKVDSENKEVQYKLHSVVSALDEASKINANSGRQLPTQSLKVSEGMNVQFAGPARETQAQISSTMSYFNQILQSSRNCEVAMDGNLQSRKSGSSPAQLDCDVRESLGALSRTTTHTLDISTGGPSNGVAHVQSLPRGNDMGSSSLNVPENIKITETGQEKDAAQRNSGTQYYGMAEISKEKAQSSSLQKKTLRQNSSTQNMSDSIGNYSMILNPSNRQLNSVARDPTATKTVHPESNIHASMNNYLCSRPVVQPSKLHRGLVVSQGNILVNSLDSMRVTSVSNNSVSVNRLAAESEHSQLRNMKEIPQATAQKFVNFTGGVFGHSVSMAYCTSSIDPTFTSQRDSLQEASMQSETSQFVNHPCPFGNSMRFTSVTVPQVVSPALFAGQLGEGKTAEGISYGCITVQDQPNLCNFRSNPSADKPNPCNFRSNPSAVQQPAHNSSICPPQKQNGSNQASNNSFFGIENGSYGGNLVVGVPPCAYTAQSDAQVLSSSNSNGRGCTSGSLTTSQLYQGAYRRQHSATNTSHSSGLITTQRLSDTSDVNTIDCCGETALFGNPILRLMGKNLMVANKDGGQPKQLDKIPTSMEEYPNANYLRLLGFTSEENFWQDGNSYLNQPLESSITFDQNNLHTPEGLRRRDSRSLGGYCYQPPTAAGNISDVWLRRLSVPPSQSSAGANSVNIGPAGSQLGFTSPTIKYTLSHIPSTSMEKGMSYRPVGANFQAKKKPPSSAGSQSVHEVIIIDDSPDEGPVAPIPILEPTSFGGRSTQSQEGHSTPRISKANSKFRSGNTTLQTAPSCFSALTESSVACGSNLPNAGMYRQN